MSFNGGALEGIRVLDLSHFLSGPRCTQLLADMGAEVIKIEPPTGEAMRMIAMLAGAERILSLLNRNKRGMVLDLQMEQGQALLKELVLKADILVENSSPRWLEGLGLGYQELHQLNPELIYASISGFGNSGPLKGRTAFDIIAQATGGSMSSLGLIDHPPSVFFGDLVSGVYCALAITQALLVRERGGQGQHVDISMQDVIYNHCFSYHCMRALDPVSREVAGILGRPIGHLFNDPDKPMCFWNVYRASDGRVAVVALTDSQWRRLMEVIGREELLADPRFINLIMRIHNAAEGIEVLAPWMAAHSVAEVIEKLSGARIPCGPVQDEEALNRDEQLKSRGMLGEVDHPRLGKIGVPGIATVLSGTPGALNSAAPDLGAHTSEILREILGYSTERIEALQEEGVVLLGK